MKLNSYTTLALLLLSCSGYALADDPVIRIVGQETSAPKIIVRSAYYFEQSISLKVRTDPKLLPSDVLIKAISKIGMVDAYGVSITTGFDVSADHDIVIGFSGGISEIIKIGQSFYRPTIIASFKDRSGAFVSPPKDTLALYNTSGQKLCFDYESVHQAKPKMAFILLLDHSGSMYSVMDEVKKSAKDFLRALPRSSLCSVASFNHDARYHNTRFENCNSGHFKIDSIDSGGGTNLFEPLLASYQTLNQNYFKDYQKAVIVITDGQLAGWIKMPELKVAKKSTLSFAYLLGDSSDELLKDIADGYLHDPKNVEAGLGEYFHSLSNGYRAQKVLRIKQCPGGAHAKP